MQAEARKGATHKASRGRVIPSLLAFTLAHVAIASWPPPTRAAGASDPPPSMELRPARDEPPLRADEPMIGCGKAQAAIRGFLAEEIEPPSAQYLEAFTDTDVLHYDLDIELTSINPATNSCFIDGSNTMTVRSKSPGLTEFRFRLRSQYTIFGATINGGTPVSVTTESSTTRRVTLDRAYGVDEEFTLTIPYSGGSVSAFFGSFEVDTHSGSIPVVSSLSEPYYAYTWWPVKDGDVGLPGDNSDKSTADVSVTVPGSMTVVSNGVLLGTQTLSGGRKRFDWSTNYPIAPYLIAISTTQYNTWTQTYVYDGGTMPVEFYLYPSNDTPSNRTAYELSLTMLDVLGDLYGPYPFLDEKYAIYNFPFSGGMEHQTCTGQSSAGETLTAHELAHQWWGDAVTCETWSDIWLNEGFATYSECLWLEYKTGVPNFTSYKACINSRKPSSVGDSVWIPPAQTADPFRIFSGTYSYNKGAWVLHQLRHIVGDAVFFDILAAHRAAHEDGAATTAEFAAVASSTAGQDLSWFFNQCVYAIGAPAYQFGWQSTTAGGQNYLLLRIAQTQIPSYPNVFTMPVDVRATIGGSPQTLTVWNDAHTEWFVVPVPGPVTTLAFDPDEWILRTAATNVAYAAGPPKLVGAAPAPGEELDYESGTNQVSLTFHTPVNLTASDVLIEGDLHGPVAFTVASAPGANPVVLQLAAPLEADAYTVTIQDAVTALNSGMALDGEMTDPQSLGSLPSGNGLAGGDAVYSFTVVRAIPTVSTWGLLALGLSLLVFATLRLRVGAMAGHSRDSV